MSVSRLTFLRLWIMVLLGLSRHCCHALATMSMTISDGTTSSFSNTAATSATMIHNKRHTLYDMPVSNNGARCRIILYKKGLTPDQVRIAPPTELGGLQSADYRRINPIGKMPALTIERSNSSEDIDANSAPLSFLNHLGESDTIARYLLSEYQHAGPSFLPNHARSNWIARLHDMYLSPIQGALYKAVPPFGVFGTRADAIAEYVHQLELIESLMMIDDDENNNNMYLCGQEISLADATLFPSLVFCEHMFPKFASQPQIPSKLLAWYQRLKFHDDACRQVYQEMHQALQSWDAKNRWDSILGAGWRDTAPDTIFDKILAREVPADIVYETPQVLAFRDINPAAPAHVLVIPKHRNGLTRLQNATAEHTEILGQLLVAAAEISRQAHLGFGNGDGARIVINDGPNGGQEVMHLHVHVIGGRAMQWPPG